MAYSPFNHTGQWTQWAQFLKSIRAYLDQKGYTEVSTPHLVEVGAFESTIDTLRVSYSTGSAELHSSPEIEMKKILALFEKPIYQICKSFRDDPPTPTHAIEFTLLEFYRPMCSSRSLEKETLNLISAVSTKQPVIKTESVYDLILKKTGINLDTATDSQELARQVKKLTSIHVTSGDSWSDIFFKIMIELIEPSLPPDTLYLLNQYPSAVSPLSKTIPNSSKADRFEIYWKGMELCNGCSELTDAAALKRRYQMESQDRIKAGKSPHPEPKDLFLSASKIDGASGVAIGLERLFKALNS